MATTEEPILSRVDRLDNVLRLLEEIRGSTNRSPKSSCASTPSSGTLTSDGIVSSDFSPRSLEKHCRPIDDVVMEIEVKGTLIERLVQVEERVLKMEKEMEAEKKREVKAEKRTHKKGLMQLVKSCVPGSGKGKGKAQKVKERTD